MTPVKFDQQNFVWGRPPGATEEQVGEMPAFKGKEEGTDWPITVSCWEPTEKELAEIIKTKKVWLRVYGESHPVVAVSGENPWG